MVSRYWNGYGPYDEEENGQPHFGQVVLDFIKRNGWSIEQFGIIYGNAVRKKSYTKVRIYQMANNNSFPANGARRYIIANLLRIPGVLLGVNSLEELLARDQISTNSTTSPSLDLAEYELFLRKCWQQNQLSTAQNLVTDISQRIQSLHNHVLYAKTGEKQRMFNFLCEYHILLGKIECDQQHYDSAIEYLSKAIHIAAEKKLLVPYIIGLLHRGITLREQGSIVGGDIEKRNIYLSSRNFSKAQEFLNRVDPQLRAAISMASGDAQAYAMYLNKRFSEVDQFLSLSRSAHDIIKNSSEISTLHFVRFNEERFHLAMASTLIDTNRPGKAFEHLDILLSKADISARRYAYLNILLAQAYLKKQLFPMATTCASQAITIAKSISSTVNISRVARIYDELCKSPYGNQIEVVQLKVELMQAQYPEIFG